MKMIFDINKYIEENKNLINKHLDEYLEVKYPEKIWEAIRYTVLLDGKRIRPILTLEACKVCKGDIKNAIPTACAVEMLHAQSLIHDDLPCMDNDDLRRGKPTNHKVFGEANAVLAGDALLSFAPQIIIQKTPKDVPREILIKVLEEFFITAGALKLIGGQVVDIESEQKDIKIETLEYIHKNKTGALFEFSLRSGALLANADESKIYALTKYAELIGLAFQISDDILDILGSQKSLGKTIGKDKTAGKKTHPDFYGIETSKKETEKLIEQAIAILVRNNLDSPGLVQIAQLITKRIK